MCGASRHSEHGRLRTFRSFCILVENDSCSVPSFTATADALPFLHWKLVDGAQCLARCSALTVPASSRSAGIPFILNLCPALVGTALAPCGTPPATSMEDLPSVTCLPHAVKHCCPDAGPGPRGLAQKQLRDTETPQAIGLLMVTPRVAGLKGRANVWIKVTRTKMESESTCRPGSRPFRGHARLSAVRLFVMVRAGSCAAMWT